MNTSFHMKALALLTVLLGFAGSVPAQTSIDWLTLDAAAGAQSSARYAISFTAGQTDVGPTAPSSARYRIVPGFWALEDVDPVSSPPELRIVLSGANVVLTWPSMATGFVLEQTDSLDALPASWSDTPGLANDNGTIKSLTIPHDVARRFYRLRKPSP